MRVPIVRVPKRCLNGSLRFLNVIIQSSRISKHSFESSFEARNVETSGCDARFSEPLFSFDGQIRVNQEGLLSRNYRLVTLNCRPAGRGLPLAVLRGSGLTLEPAVEPRFNQERRRATGQLLFVLLATSRPQSGDAAVIDSGEVALRCLIQREERPRARRACAEEPRTAFSAVALEGRRSSERPRPPGPRAGGRAHRSWGQAVPGQELGVRSYLSSLPAFPSCVSA